MMKRLMIVLMLIFLLSACAEQEDKELDYDDFEHLTAWSEINGLEDGTIFVYYYSPYCSACQTIKQVVLEYADDNHPIPLYLMVSDDYRSQGTPPTSIQSIPALLIYEGHQFDRMLSGSTVIRTYLINA